MDTTNDAEVLAVEIKTDEGDVTVSNLYMLPPTRTWDKDDYKNMEDTTQTIRMLLQNAENENKGIIINGELNSNID